MQCLGVLDGPADRLRGPLDVDRPGGLHDEREVVDGALRIELLRDEDLGLRGGDGQPGDGVVEHGGSRQVIRRHTNPIVRRGATARVGRIVRPLG